MQDKDNFLELIRQKRERDQAREVKIEESCKERLKKIAKTKMTTIMIGALDSIEKNLGFLFGLDDDGQPTHATLSNEETHIKRLYDNIRSTILDLGNDQIKNLHKEIDMHKIEWNRYHLTLPIRPEGPKNAQEQSDSK